MNNNRGWGLRSELWICLAITVFFVIAVILINRVSNDIGDDLVLPTEKNPVVETNKKDNNSDKEELKSANYESLEDKLVLSGTKYAAKYLKNEEIGNVKYVTVVRLQTENILDKLEINNIECSGYIKIEKIDDDFKYYPYIKCGNSYKTVGYNESLDNTDL